MPLVFDEIIAAAIVDAIFGYVVEQGAGDWVRDKLRRDPAKLAYQRALINTSAQFNRRHPQASANLFDRSFFEHEAAPILAQFLIRNGHPSPYDMAAAWATSLNMAPGERRTTSTRKMEPIAADFLDLLAHALQAESDLAKINDQRALQRTADGIAAIRSAFSADRATPGTRRDYLHWLRERNLYLDARGTLQTQRQVQLKLNDIYIALRAQPEMTSGKLDRDLQDKLDALESEIALGKHMAAEIEDQREHLAALAHIRHTGRSPTVQTTPIELSDTVSHNDKLVVLGDPGSGKTTLLRYLALMHAEALLYDQPDAGANLGPSRFPIYVRIADYAETGAWRTRSLSDFLAENYTRLECPHAGLADLLTSSLATGNCLVLLDGLDEIVSADERRGVIAQIENFVRRHDDQGNHFVVSSRIAGYRSAPLGDPYAHFIIQDMDEDEIRRFLNTWCRAVEDADTPDLSPEARAATAQREIDAILHALQTSPGVRRLATNPLLLRTLALIHRTGAQLPQKRVELYKLAADTLARTWRIASGISESALVKDEYLTPLLGRLAYWMHANKPTGIATEREIYIVLGEAWADINDLDWDSDQPKPAIQEEVRKFLLTIREHTGLFVERAPQRYGFMHLTFEEYYAARHLVARNRIRARLIRQHLHDPRWEEPILLALGFVGLDSPDDARELIELAILAQGDQAGIAPFLPSHYEDLLGRDYLFALRCLADQIPVRPRLMRRLIERLANEYTRGAGSARFQRYRESLEQQIGQLTSGEACLMLASLLQESLRDSEATVREAATQTLRRMAASSPEVLSALLAALRDPEANVREAAAQALRRMAASSPEVVTALLAALRDPEANVREVATQAFKGMADPSPEVVLALLVALRDPEANVREVAAQALSGIAAPSPEVVTALLAALRDSEATVREAATQALRRMEVLSPEVVSALLAALRDSEATVRVAAAQALHGIAASNPEVVTALLAALRDPKANVRVAAAQALRGIAASSPEVMVALLAALRDPEASVRVIAAQALRRMAAPSPEVVSALLAALHNPEATVREAAAQALRRMEALSPEVVSALLAALRDSKATVREAATQALRRMAALSPEVMSALLMALRDPEAMVREAVARAFSRRAASSPEVVTALVAALRDPEANVREVAARALSRIEASSLEVVTALLAALRDPEANVREVAARALSKIEASSLEVVTALLAALHDPEANVREVAARALSRIEVSSPQVMSALLAALRDPQANVREVAARALSGIAASSPEVVSALLAALRDPEATVREVAARTLSKIEASSLEVLSALLEALRDPQANVREVAAQALSRIEASSPEVVLALVAALRDPEANVREVAARALSRIEASSPEVVLALVAALRDPEANVRVAAAQALSGMAAPSPDILPLLPAVIHRSSLWAFRSNAARLIGEIGSGDDDSIHILWRGLLDRDNDVRMACVEALALLARRFPASTPNIEERLLQAINDPEFALPDEVVGRSGHDYAFDSLWMLVAGIAPPEE